MSLKRIGILRRVVAACLLGWLSACTPSQTPRQETGGGTGATGSPSVPAASLDRGRVIYSTQCAICHHADPKKAGAIGPEVFGSSKELLFKRVLEAKYPDGYKPKRETKSMAPLPHLKHEIESLHLFLNQQP